MDKGNDRTVALLSIHPIYADRLLQGSKCVELRKTKFKSEVEYVIIYATAPVKKVVGYFEVDRVVVDSPAAIWQQYRPVAGIEEEDFQTYYQSSSYAVAIEVGKMFPLSSPLPLSILGEEVRAPQSFRYFSAPAVEILADCVSQ